MSLGKRSRSDEALESAESPEPDTKRRLEGPYHRNHEMKIEILSDDEIKKITDRIGRIEPGDGDNNARHTLDYFVDGSLEMLRPRGSGPRTIHRGEARLGGYAVVSSFPPDADDEYDQNCHAFLVEKAYSIVQMEKMGVVEALAIALNTVKHSDGKLAGSLVRIFGDSVPCLRQLEIGISPSEYTGQYARDITRPIDEAAVELWAGLKQYGCDVILYWVPRNSTREHKRADKLSSRVWTTEYRGEPVKKATRQEETKGLDEKVEKALETHLDNYSLVGRHRGRYNANRKYLPGSQE